MERNSIFKRSQLNGVPSDRIDVVNFMTISDDDDDEQHPILEKLTNHAVEEVDIVNSWTDDHLFCCLLEFKFVGDDEHYFLPLWRMNPTILLKFGRAVNNIEVGKELAEYLKS